MSILNLIEDIGEDLDLLVRSDEWLEEERKSISAELDRIASELRSIYTAQRLKRYLKQSDLVAVQSLVKDDNGEVSDIQIAIMPVKEAIKYLRSNSKDDIDTRHKMAQISCWKSDGYDTL
jgi:hypothetical protein